MLSLLLVSVIDIYIYNGNVYIMYKSTYVTGKEKNEERSVEQIINRMNYT